MKKTFLVIVGLLAMTAATVVRAQDTLDGRILRENYFYYGQTPDHTAHPPHVNMLNLDGGGEIGKRFYTDSSLTVYGIAAAVGESHEFLGLPTTVYDTSSAKAFEYLRLYTQEQDTLRWLRQVRVNPILNPIAYYARFDTAPTPNNGGWVAPVYERYFDSAITVSDSFYVGMTYFIPQPYRYKGITYDFKYRPVFIYLSHVVYEDYSTNRKLRCFFTRNANNDIIERSWSYGTEGVGNFILYPILTPPDSDYVFDSQDTTVVNSGDTLVMGNDTIAMGDTLIVCDTTIIGGDTIVNYDTILAIVQPDMLQRFTGVMPNPAAEKARVVSSFGMSMVEVYNASGALVHTQRADGLYVDLDVSRWPAGTYLVRIHTPQGIATKRLVVSR